MILLYQRLDAIFMSMHQFISLFCLKVQASTPDLLVGKLNLIILYKFSLQNTTDLSPSCPLPEMLCHPCAYLRLWDMKSNALSESDSIHKKDITNLQIYRQYNAVITTDSSSIVALWKYRKEFGKISIIPVSSFHTQKTNIMPQLMPGNGVAVFYNDTGELKLYTELNEANIKKRHFCQQMQQRQKYIPCFIHICNY